MKIPTHRAVVWCSLFALAGVVGCKREPEAPAPTVAEQAAPSPTPDGAPVPAAPTLSEVTPTPESTAPTPPPRPVEPAPRATPKTSPAPPPAPAERSPTPTPQPSSAPTLRPSPAAPPPPPEEKPTPALPPAAETTSGQQVFLVQKCNTCHAVSSAGIAAKTMTAGKPVGGDLKGIGERRSRQSIENVAQQKEQVDGKKHPKKFSGSPAELAALVDWLLAQK